MKILAFGASTSSTSINRQLANHAAGLVPGADVTNLDLASFDLPLFSADEETRNGIPPDAGRFLETIRAHDAIVISMAEHNGSYAAAFKNLYDWTSRIEGKLWSDKPMLLLSTSPGGRGGATVLAEAAGKFPRMGADLRGTFSLPSFHEHYSAAQGITDPDLAANLAKAVQSLQST